MQRINNKAGHVYLKQGNERYPLFPMIKLEKVFIGILNPKVDKQ